jgi:hypothetical protein
MAKTEDPKTPLAATENADEERRRKHVIEVRERRAQGIDLHGRGMPEIRLLDPSMKCRWSNEEIPGKIWHDMNEGGWEKVRPAELADPMALGGFTVSPDGYVVRGPKGTDHLMKMPRKISTEIERRKAEQNIRDMDPHRQKAQVAEAAGKSLGDQAGSFINENVSLVGSIKTTRERIAVTPEVQ